ncbi:MAG: chromosomal replication initiator DnaA [Caulobacter sp.]|nr:chromosomal replication initiator DnaA [Caulobacter sp.]
MTPRAKQLSLGLARPPVYTRAAFVASAANEAALAAVEAWPAWPGGALALVGPEGCGKTHLATVWAERAGAGRYQPGDAGEGRPVLVEDADLIGDEALFHLINRPPSDGGLLLTARTRPAAWPATLPDLRSRLNALTVAEIGAPDDALMIAVLEALLREKHIRAAPDLYEFLLRRMERSVTAARAIVTRLDEAAAEQGRPVNRALARELLEATADLFEG